MERIDRLKTAADEQRAILRQVRRTFLAAGRTLPNRHGDFSGWHCGRPYFALWALDMQAAAVQQRVAAAAAHLDGLLLGGYRRQPHITLSLCGFPCGGAAGLRADDCSAASLRRQIAVLRGHPPPSFDLELGGLASFTSAPFLTVSDAAGGIANLRVALAESDINRLCGPYVPHVTVGLYGGGWSTGEVDARLGRFADSRPLRCRIERLSLMVYRSSEVGGELYRLLDVALESGDLHCKDNDLCRRVFAGATSQD